MDNLKKLEEIFVKFPGIGPRQARRFVYYLLINKSPSAIREFTHLIEEVKKSAQECEQCCRIFFGQGKAGQICSICSNKDRDISTLMIVARDSDLETIEKSDAYKGLYFILGGTVPILDKEPDRKIRLQKLLELVTRMKDLKEIILSLNATPDGEHTAVIVKEALGKVFGNRPVKINTLGRGLSTGAELEYADSETIRNALGNRR